MLVKYYNRNLVIDELEQKCFSDPLVYCNIPQNTKIKVSPLEIEIYDELS